MLVVAGTEGLGVLERGGLVLILLGGLPHLALATDCQACSCDVCHCRHSRYSSRYQLPSCEILSMM